MEPPSKLLKKNLDPTFMVMEHHCADKELGPKVTLLANSDIYVSPLNSF